MSSTVIHLRDPHILRTSVHFLVGIDERQLTDDPDKVTCGTCRRMIKRQKSFRERDRKERGQ